MNKKYDILIIGSGPVGLFFAIKMAINGIKTLVVEKDRLEDLGKRYDVFHLPLDLLLKQDFIDNNIDEFGIISSFQKSISRSSFDRFPKVTNKNILGIHRHIFLRKLVDLAKEKGVEFYFNSQYLSLIYDKEGKICGAKIKNNENEDEIFSKLIIDASGIESVVRKDLKDRFIERFDIGSKDKFYVVLNYIKFDNPEKDKVNFPIGWPYYKTWIAPSHDKEGAIIGIGSNYSFEYAEYCLKKFLSKIKLPSFVLQYIEKSCTPYHRFLYSFVSDNFIVLGDAACLTDPMNGEGIALGWFHANIAAEIIKDNFKNNIKLKNENLWQINKKFYDQLGSKLIFLFSLLPYIVDCSEEENDYEFEKSIIFVNDKENPLKFIFIKLINGLFHKKLKFKTVSSILKGLFLAFKLLIHYKKYPANPKKFDRWALKSDKIWSNIKSMADVSLSDYESFQKGVY